MNIISIDNETNYQYVLVITNNSVDGYQMIKYKDLLKKFKKINFNTNHIILENFDINSYVYCSYNYGTKLDTFFRAYDKVLKNEKFNILFEYGNIINDKFIINNTSGPARKYFIASSENKEKIITDKSFKKVVEIYQIIDKNGIPVSEDKQTEKTGFETDFFNRPEVSVILRKSKLEKLKNKNNGNFLFS